MKLLYTTVLILFTGFSAFTQIRKVESLPVSVNYSKTIHLIFPAAVKYYKSVTDFVVVDNPEAVPNILRIKANQQSFNKETSVSVATADGLFYSFNVTYADTLIHTNYFLPGMTNIKADTIFINEVSQTHLIAPEKVIYIDYGDIFISVSKAEGTENIIRLIATSADVKGFPSQTNVSFATADGKFYTYNVDYKQNPDAFVFEVGITADTNRANVILSDNVISAYDRDKILQKISGEKRHLYSKGIIKNGIVFSVNNIHICNDLLFFTFQVNNNSRIPYDIDYIRYFIVDRKTAKLTASQENDQTPLFTHNYTPRIEGKKVMKYIAAFNKFTIPDDKVFRIEINEKNGGRHIIFDLENNDIVNAEGINF